MKRQYNPYPVWTPYVFLAPFLVVFAIFLVYPLLQSVLLSMEQTFGPQFKTFVFLHNFSNLMKDPMFFKALKNTTLFAAASVLLQMPLSLGLAIFLNRAEIRGRAFFRLIIFSPDAPHRGTGTAAQPRRGGPRLSCPAAFSQSLSPASVRM